MVEKLKMDVDRLLLTSKLKIENRNVDDKHNIAFPLLVGILTSTSKSLRKLLSIVVQHLLSPTTDEWSHFPSDAFGRYIPTNSTLNYVCFNHDNVQSRIMNC